MNDAVRTALQQQIGHEFFAANAYLSMCAYFESENLPGFASWMRHHSLEEAAHAMKIFDFLTDRGVAPEIPEVPKPPSGFTSLLHVLETAYAHERTVTGQIHNLYELALAKKDYPAQMLLQWFISEQLEEEKLTSGVLERARMVEGSRSALLILDAELGSRRGEGHAHHGHAHQHGL